MVATIKKSLFVFLIVFLTNACFTPVGKIPDADFVWEEKAINFNYQEVYRNISNGLRSCQQGMAEGNLYTDTKEGYFDIYLTGLLGGKHQGVLGIVRLKSAGLNQTSVRVGVQNVYDGNGAYRKKWLTYAEGKTSCE
jgi:hypothetical protein